MPSDKKGLPASSLPLNTMADTDRMKNTKGGVGALNDFNLNVQLAKDLNSTIDQLLKEQQNPIGMSSVSNNAGANIPKRKAKGHRAMLVKILEEVGYDDIFKDGEINDGSTTLLKGNERLGRD